MKINGVEYYSEYVVDKLKSKILKLQCTVDALEVCVASLLAENKLLADDLIQRD